MKKFFLIPLMAFVMLFSADAWAQNVAKIVETGTEYTTLQKAVKEATAGQTVQLIADINCAQGVYVDKSLTIDLAGFTYQSEGANDSEAGQACSARNFKIVGNGTVVTIKNGRMIAYAEAAANYQNKSGAATGKGNLTANGAYGTIRTEAGSTVNLENLELYNYHPWGLNIKICSTANNSLDNLQINPSTANIRNCKVISNIGGGIEVAGGIANIESTTFTQEGKNLKYGYIATCVAVSTLGRLTVNTTSFKSTGDHAIYVYSSGGLIQVESGVFAGLTDVINITRADATTVAINIYDTDYNSMSAEDKAKARTQAQKLITDFVTELGGTDTENASQIIVKDGDFDGKIVLAKEKEGEPDVKLAIEGGTFANTGMTDEQFEQLINTEVVQVVVNPDGTKSIVEKTAVEEDFTSVDENSVVTVNTNEEITGDVTVKQVNINDGSSVTVKDGGVLHINGQMGAIIADNGRLNIEAGGKVFVENGLIHNENAASINIQSKENKPAILLIAPSTQMYGEDNPKATVQFVSKAYYNSASDYRNQRFGIPTIGGLEAISSTNDIQVQIQGYFNGKWEDLGHINRAAGYDASHPALDLTKMNQPFAYYQMACFIPSTEEHPTITMTGSLVGNSNPELTTAAATYTTFANSYMGNMALTPLYDAIAAVDGIAKTVWTYRPVADNTFAWKSYNRTVMCFGAERALEPMQAFYIKNNGIVTTLNLNYEGMVWNKRNTAFTAIPDEAPARRAAADFDVKAQLTVLNNGEEVDDIYMLQGSQFTADFEDGWDSEKGMNENASLYIMGQERQGTLATDDMNNTYLGFACQSEGIYTIRFSNIEGNEMVLVDLANGNRINMEEGNEYSFIANGENDYRFQLVGRQNMPTALENTEAAKKNEGIYTITGQYIGTMSVWNTLPQGVYVVDGVKKVK